MPGKRHTYWQRMWVQRAVCGLLAINVGSLAVSVSPGLRLLARNVSPKLPLFAGLGAAVCKPLQLGAFTGACRHAGNRVILDRGQFLQGIG